MGAIRDGRIRDGRIRDGRIRDGRTKVCNIRKLASAILSPSPTVASEKALPVTRARPTPVAGLLSARNRLSPNKSWLY
jgi:hypothetical protein